MRKVSKHFYIVILLSILSSFVYLPAAQADTSAPEIISVKALAPEVFVGKKWTGLYFEVIVKDESNEVNLNKILLKSTNIQIKNISCAESAPQKNISGNFFEHSRYIYCQLPMKVDAPDVRFIQFTVTDGAGLSTAYTTDIFNAKVNFIYGFDPKVIEQSQTDSGKLRLVGECTNYEQVRLSTLDIHKTVAKLPAGYPFEATYKEGKIALAKPFTCNLGSDLLTRVSDYEDLITRLRIDLSEVLTYQLKVQQEKIEAYKAPSITCVKGKLSRVVKGMNAKCPAGFKKKK
jgi:hypothetical protein